MKDQNQTEMQLINELVELRKRIAELKTLENERKQAEEALRKSEERYRTLFEESRDAIYTTSQEGEILDANESMLNLFGYSRGDMIGLQARETYVHSDDRLKFKQKIEREGFVRDYEVKLRKKDGTEMDCLLTAIVRRTADGNIVGYQGIIRDITERKRAEEEYRTILRTTMDGFWITDIQGRFLDVNDAYCQLIGYSRDELLTKRISDVEAVERSEETAQHIQRIMKTGGTRFETRHSCKDGRIIDIEVSVNYAKIGGERLYVFLRDITERKWAEEALRESEVRYRLLAENASDIIWTVNMNMQVTYISPSVTRLLGYTVEEAKSRTMEEAFTPASLETARRAFAEEMALENARQGDSNRSRILELELTRKDGGVVLVEANFSFLRDAMGKPVGILSIARDITERKRMEEERKKLIHELQDALVNVKTLRGLLPICSYCKKIRDDKGYWNRIESYIEDHSGAEFTHGMCPECLKKYHPDLLD
jgi:PAS domain S-box-containing protein